MCGRFSLAMSKEKISKHFNMRIKYAIASSYNIAPTQEAYVITNEKPNELQRFKWGLVPYWSRDDSKGSKLINARRENISSKPSFRMPIRKRRCLIPADSFYEWKKMGGEKQPFRISFEKGKIMVFAGVWDNWVSPVTGEELNTFSIITTEPNKEMREVHARMPVILTTLEEQHAWLADTPLNEALDLLQTIADGSLRIQPISTKVNSVEANTADIHTPIKLPPTLF